MRGMGEKIPFELRQEEIAFEAIRAQGAGGQNVNKVSNAVHLRFDIRASSLPEELKARLLARRDQRISGSEELRRTIADDGVGAGNVAEGLGYRGRRDELHAGKLGRERCDEVFAAPDDQLLRRAPASEIAARDGALAQPGVLDEAVDRDVGAGSRDGCKQ